MGSKAGARCRAGARNGEQETGRVGSPLSSGNKFLCQFTASWKCTHRRQIGAVISFSLLLSQAVFCSGRKAASKESKLKLIRSD